MMKYCLIFLALLLVKVSDATAKLPTSFSIAAPEIPPLIFYNDKQELVGTLVEKLKKFSKLKGIKVKIEVMTWARALTQVKYHKHNALMPAIKTADRENYLSYPKQALIHFNSTVLIENKRKQPIDISLDSNQKQFVAKARSMLLGDEMDALIAKLKLTVIEVNSIESAIKMLAMNRVDFVAADKDITLSIINKLSLNDSVNIKATIDESDDSYLAFSHEFSSKYDINKLMELILGSNDSDIFISSP